MRGILLELRRGLHLYKLFMIFLFVFFNTLSAYDLPTLIQDYEKASELSLKTKNENAGNLVIYTRDDLERMQALTLKDILKTLRYFSYSEDKLGQADMLNLDAFSNQSKGIRLYLNEHELLSPLNGSGFSDFGDMELEFVDHIEIYTGFPSFEFGIAPATVVIRLYTKDAKHDEGGKVKLLGGTYGSHLASAYYTDRLDDFSYFTYLGEYNNDRKSYNNDGSHLNRDQLRDRFYGSLSTQNHRLELHAVKNDDDAFMGKFNNFEIQDNEREHQYISISSHSEFMEKSLKFNLSYTSSETEIKETLNIRNSFAPSISTYDKTEEESLTALLEKKWNLRNHDISLGLQYRYKTFDIEDVYFGGLPTSFTQTFDNEQIYSLYLQDLYHLNDNSVFSFSVMNQFYQRDGNVDEPNNSQLRLGYIYTDKKFSAKTTLSSQEFAAEPYMIVDSRDGNSNLKSERYNSISQELIYSENSTINNLIFSYAKLSDYPLIGTSRRWENSDKDLEIFTSSYALTYLYSQKDKLEFHLNYSYSNTAYTAEKAKTLSALLRSLNTLGKFDIFNEFWIIDSAFNSSVRLDYSAGIKYHATKDFSLQIKGENIFNRAQERSYSDINLGQGNIVTISVIDPKVWFGLEYLF